MKGFLRIIFFLSAALIMNACSSCSKLGDITVNRYNIVSLRPQGLRCIVGTVSIEETNNGPTVTVTSLNGKIFKGDELLGTISLEEPLILPGPKTCWTDINARIVLEPDFSALTIVRLLRNPDLSEFTVSFKAKMKVGPLKAVYWKNDIPLEKLIRK